MIVVKGLLLYQFFQMNATFLEVAILCKCRKLLTNIFTTSKQNTASIWAWKKLEMKWLEK